jgi:hypothetical protein
MYDVGPNKMILLIMNLKMFISLALYRRQSHIIVRLARKSHKMVTV